MKSSGGGGPETPGKEIRYVREDSFEYYSKRINARICERPWASSQVKLELWRVGVCFRMPCFVYFL